MLAQGLSSMEAGLPFPEEACSSCAEQQGPTDFLPQSLHWPVWVYFHGLRCRWAFTSILSIEHRSCLVDKDEAQHLVD